MFHLHCLGQQCIENDCKKAKSQNGKAAFESYSLWWKQSLASNTENECCVCCWVYVCVCTCAQPQHSSQFHAVAREHAHRFKPKLLPNNQRAMPDSSFVVYTHTHTNRRTHSLRSRVKSLSFSVLGCVYIIVGIRRKNEFLFISVWC